MPRLFLAALAVALLAPGSAAAVGKILAELPCPVAEPMGMTADGNDHLWIADMATRTLVRVRTSDGAIVSRIPAPGNMPMGLALFGDSLFSADRSDDWISRLSLSGAVGLASVPFYERWPFGLAHDGRHLWVANARDNRLHEIDPEDGTTIRSFDAPAGATTGLAFDGADLWVADHGTDEIYRVDRRDGSVILPVAAPGPYPSALAAVPGALWVADFQTRKLTKVSLADDAPFVEDRERRIHVSYEVAYRTKNGGKVKDLVVYLSLPREIPGQHLLGELSFDPKPARFESDQWGQKVAVVEIGALGPGEVRRVRWEGDLAVYRTRFQISPAKVESSKSEPGLEQYLADDAKYDLKSPVVGELVEKLTRGKKTRWDKARALYEHLAKTISYERSGGWNDAAAVLERGNGSCSEYTFTLVALLRRAGIPARYVGALSERGDEASFDDVFHRWAEAYFPGYGWVPLDANAAHGGKPGERGFFFGGRSNRHVVTTVGGGGSRLLGWDYNHHETWKAEAGANLDVQPLARYRPLPPRAAPAP